MLNLAGLVALLVGFLYLNQFREGLIEARVQSLLTQGEIIAGAIAGSATVETNTITIDPDQLLQMQAGETERFTDEALSSLEFSINPERVAPLLRRLVTPTKTRARIFDRDGLLLLDSRSFYSRGDILRMDLPPVANVEDTTSVMERTWNSIRKMFRRTKRPGARGDRPRQRQVPAGSAAGLCRPAIERGARQHPGRDHRLGGRADPALPRGRRARSCSRPRKATSTPSSPPSASPCCRSSWSRPS